MAVGFDAATEGGPFGATPDPATFSHAPSGTPRGVLVFVIFDAVSPLAVTGVTYGGSTLTDSGFRPFDIAGEAGQVQAFFLGSSVPTGTQTVSVDHSGTSAGKYVVCITVTAAADTEIYTAGVQERVDNQTLAEVSVDDGSPGTNSMRFAGLHSGLSTVPSVGSNTTAIHDHDYGQRVVAVARETNAGQGSRSLGWSSGTSDDVAALYLAVREIPLVERHGGMVRATTALQAVQRSATWMRRHDGLLLPRRRLWVPA